MDAEYEAAWFLEMTDGPVPPPENVHVETIIRLVCEYYGVSKIDLFSARRTKNLTRPRQMISYLSKMYTMRSLPEIGRRMGGRDHTTILHGIRQVEKRLIYDDATKEAFTFISRQLGGPAIAQRIHPRRVLSPADVRAIRASAEHPTLAAERYHITPMSVRNIRARRTWAGVD